MSDRGSQIAAIVVILLIERQALVAAPVPSSREINTRSSQLHLLDPKRISETEQRPWHPAELVAIVGNQRGRHWQSLSGVSFSPDGKWIAANAHAYIYLPGSIYLWEAPNLRFQGLLPVTATFMQFARERNSLLTCGPDGLVRLWNMSDGKPRSKIVLRDVPICWRDDIGAFSHVALSPDSKKLAVATGDGFNYYDISVSPPKKYYTSLGQGMTLLKAAFSPDSLRFVTLKGEVGPLSGFLGRSLIHKQEATLWDVSRGVPKLRCALTGPIWWWGRISFSPDGKVVVCGANVWDLSDDKPKFRGAMKGDKADAQELLSGSRKLKNNERPLEGENIEECLFLPDSRHALTTGHNFNSNHGYIRIRDMSQREPRILQTISATRAFCSYQTMALSPDAKHFAVGEGNCLNLWEIKTEKIEVHPPSLGHTQPIMGMSFGACGNLLATIARDGTLRLWDLDGPLPHERLLQKQKFSFSWDTVAVSPDGSKLAAGFQGGNDGFTLWELSRSGLRVLAEHKKGGRFLSFSPDSKLLFASNGRDSHKVIDVFKPMETVHSLDLGRRGAQSFLIGAIAISPDWRTLAVGGNHELELWQRTESGWQKQTNARAPCDVKSISFIARGGPLLLGGGFYKKPEVHLYDLTGDSPQPIAAFSGLRDVALSVTASSTGKMFAATDETGRVVVWSASGKKLHEWTFPGPVHCVSFAPDGRHLALGNGDGTVYILRLASPAKQP